MAGAEPMDELTTDEPSDFGSLKPGTRLGRYELLVPVARGGMARVWAARQHGQRGFQKLVAIKVILPHLADEPDFERMFLDEARIASGVHHPNVCEIYELGEERHTLYLAMEWCNGDSLSRVLRATGKTEAIDVRVAARVVADACAGVHAAHELTDDDGRHLNVVHRDMSPHNVLLTADGLTKVCDFGVAKALGQLHEQTSAGQLKGKVSYMSPEQVTGGLLDRRSDVFSLGCVLYEATTGMRPFQGDRDHMVLHAILKNEVTPPTQLLRNYPPALEHIVMRALSPKPILRFPTAERMRFALEEFLAKGQLVTQANVAQVVRARIGDVIDRRREKIKQASSNAEQQGAWEQGRSREEQRSGVKPLTSTLPLDPAPYAPRPEFERASSNEPTAHGFEPPTGETPVVQPKPAVRPLPEGLPRKNTVKMGAVLPGVSTAPPPMATPLPVPTLQRPATAPSPLASFKIPAPGSLPPSAAAPRSGPPSQAPRPSSPDLRHPSLPPGSLPVPAPRSDPRASLASIDLGTTPRSLDATSVRFDASAPAEPSGLGHYLVAAFVGLVLAVLIGGGGFWLWRSRAQPPPAVADAPPPTAVAPPPVASPRAPPAASLSVVPAVATSVAAAPAGSIAITSDPAEPPPSALPSASASAPRPHVKPRPREPKDPAVTPPENPY